MPGKRTRAGKELSPVGERIRQARRNLGMTQKELGDAIGVTDRTVISWEKGEFRPDVTVVRKLADVLQVSIPWIWHGEEDGAAPGDYERMLHILRSIEAKVDELSKEK